MAYRSLEELYLQGGITEQEYRRRLQWRSLPEACREYTRGTPESFEQQEFTWECSGAKSNPNSGFAFPLPPLQNPSSLEPAPEAFSPDGNINHLHLRYNYSDRAERNKRRLPKTSDEKLLGKRHHDWFERDNERLHQLKHLTKTGQTPDYIASFVLEDLLHPALQSTQYIPKTWTRAVHIYHYLPPLMQKILYLRNNLKRNTKTIMIATGLAHHEVNSFYYRALFLNTLHCRAHQ